LANPNWDKIIETDASEIGYRGILKQVNPENKRQRLIASNIAESLAYSSIPKTNDPLYGEFMEYLKNKKGNNPSYANTLNEEENEDLQEYHQFPYKEKIIFLEYQDVMRYFDPGNDPWILMSRYLDNAPYAAHAYKGRTYYENILKYTGSIEVTHFTAANSNEMKEDLVKKFEYQKSDSSMKASSEDDNQFNCLAGESQELEDPEEIPLEDIFEEIKNMVSRRISKGESSNEKQKTPM
nr:hypothetical protein [Tanacetum cinerariifolium]